AAFQPDIGWPLSSRTLGGGFPSRHLVAAFQPDIGVASIAVPMKIGHLKPGSRRQHSAGNRCAPSPHWRGFPSGL
ncbi:MAG TPA: hypothetical protein VGE83_03995, partial [Terracidiphilus sp.]